MKISRRTLESRTRSAGLRVYLSRISASHEAEFLAAARRSVVLHHPLIFPPRTANEFAAFLKRIRRRDVESFAIRTCADDSLVGMVNLSQIFLGPLCSAYSGYYAFLPHAGRGLMAEGLWLVLRTAFDELGLHRVEANIQPGNTASCALVKKLGFVREGFSEGYLKINGEWRDHERWAVRDELLVPREGLLAPRVPTEV